MSVNQKKLSHWQRRNNYDCRPRVDVVQPIDERRLVVYDEVSDTGRLIRKSDFSTIDRVKEMENYTCSDFSLDNMLRLGVDLKPCKLNMSGFAELDNLEYQVSKMANDLKNNQNNLKTE